MLMGYSIQKIIDVSLYAIFVIALFVIIYIICDKLSRDLFKDNKRKRKSSKQYNKKKKSHFIDVA